MNETAHTADDGGPAFPRTGGEVPGPNAPEWVEPQTGISKLDWFAGMALIGLCQADMSEEEFIVSPDLLARTAYAQAAAMLRARAAISKATPPEGTRT